MKINLSEIPAEGRSYDFSHETGELNEALADLIQDRPYDVTFTLKPLGNAYEIKGHFATRKPEICSRCGWDLELPLQRNFNDILIEDEPEYRKSHSVHGNQSVDFLAQGPEVAYYQGDVFDAGTYVHEVIALAEPFYPSCGVEDCEHLADVEKKRAELEAEIQKSVVTEKGHPAFSVLEKLKVGPAGDESEH
ncbi:MAG: DUF177 domain-containing protein [Bdellovibrionaceae bacterium]|nr:DUF177 domain-containing protein [Pseudobdellovibrionaceae bacterium]